MRRPRRARPPRRSTTGPSPRPTRPPRCSTHVRERHADVSRPTSGSRERSRRRRLLALFAAAPVPPCTCGPAIVARRRPIELFQLPTIDPLVLIAGAVLPRADPADGRHHVRLRGRSPHVTYRPEQIDVRLDDVMGIDVVKEDVVRSLNLFLAHKPFADEMGGTPRRGLLFEGAPGTGKTYIAKAMAREAGVPFLFVSATSFQSMYYGATARKIRSYFKALRKAARQEGGAIGFIEEIDAIAMARGGCRCRRARADLADRLLHVLRRPRRASLGCTRRGRGSPSAGTVAQPFMTARAPAASSTSCSCRCSRSTSRPAAEAAGLVRRQRQPAAAAAPTAAAGPYRRRPTCWSSPRPTAPTTSTPRCCVPAASTAASPSSRPAKGGRRELDRPLPRPARRTTPSWTTTSARDALAAVTQGYTPVMIEHLFDEALVNAVRRGDARDDRAGRRAGPARSRRSGWASRSPTPTTSGG